MGFSNNFSRTDKVFYVPLYLRNGLGSLKSLHGRINHDQVELLVDVIRQTISVFPSLLWMWTLRKEPNNKNKKETYMLKMMSFVCDDKLVLRGFGVKCVI